MGGCSFAVSERHPTTNCRTPDLTGIKPLIKIIWKGSMFGWVFVRCVGTSPNYQLPNSGFNQSQPLIKIIWEGSMFGWLFVRCA